MFQGLALAVCLHRGAGNRLQVLFVRLARNGPINPYVAGPTATFCTFDAKVGYGVTTGRGHVGFALIKLLTERGSQRPAAQAFAPQIH
ncbi:MAG: hypothetical protein AB8B94_11955 [Hyphomicrobiales bacterium]